MKWMRALLVTVLLTVLLVVNVHAQAAESIWLTASTTAYKTGETVIVAVNAVSSTPIQGFTFQIRYDPACLKPVNASSTIPGMNGLPLPQLSGLVDGSYASTTPQTVNGALAEVRFTALKGCQTGLTLESAALAVRNAEGFAAPLAGLSLGERNIALNIDREAVEVQAAEPVSGSVLALDPPAEVARGIPGWSIGLLVVLVVGGLGFGMYRFLTARTATSRSMNMQAMHWTAALHIKHGPHAGQSFALNKLPVVIGRSPQNDICLNDPHIQDQHAKIISGKNGYYLMGLGGETFINGRSVGRNSAVLKPGDVVRLGKSALFVFG
jgi:hypothetical protein